MGEVRRKGPRFTEAEAQSITRICSIGSAQAARSLSSLTGRSVSVSVPELKVLPLSEVPSLFGGLDIPTVGVLVPFQGDETGNILLLFSGKGEENMERFLFPGEKPDEELRLSAFAETGNIISGSYLAVLSRFSDSILINLPPVVVRDMAGAIVDTILAEVGIASDEVVALVSRLSEESGSTLVKVVLIPDPRGIDLFMQAAGRFRPGP